MKSQKLEWIRPFEVTILKTKCPKEHVDYMIGNYMKLSDFYHDTPISQTFNNKSFIKWNNGF